MNLPKIITIIRLKYHLEAIDVNNVLNQLHIRNDAKANRKGAEHTMIILEDIMPRLGYDTSELMK